MDFSSGWKDSPDEIIGLFRAVFAASEGAAEGDLIAGLVRDFFATTGDGDLFVFSARADGVLAGCIIFSRLSFGEDDRTVFVLGPVAVETGRQGQGIGQALLRHGLSEIRGRGVDVAVTYGDPAYYSKVGFEQVTEQQVRAPLKLKYPEGWLAQSLIGERLVPLKGPSRCVAALNSPDYW